MDFRQVLDLFSHRNSADLVQRHLQAIHSLEARYGQGVPYETLSDCKSLLDTLHKRFSLDKSYKPAVLALLR